MFQTTKANSSSFRAVYRHPQADTLHDEVKRLRARFGQLEGQLKESRVAESFANDAYGLMEEENRELRERLWGSEREVRRSAVRGLDEVFKP